MMKDMKFGGNHLEMVEVIFKSPDGVFDIVYSRKKTAYKVNENNIIYLEEDGFVIDEITSEENGVFIVDTDAKSYKAPVCIDLHNVDGLDLLHDAVYNFAKYLIQLRDKE